MLKRHGLWTLFSNPFLLTAQRNNSSTTPTETENLSLSSHLDYTHLQPGGGPHSMRPQLQFWPQTDENNSEDVKTV